AFGLADFAGLLRGLVADGRLARVAPAELADFAGGLHQPIVHPVLRLRLAMAAFALRDFVLMMREDEVEPAAVDVERFSEELTAHGRALDVPAGAALSPGTFPRGLAGLGPFPEREIGGGTLTFRHISPFA